MNFHPTELIDIRISDRYLFLSIFPSNLAYEAADLAMCHPFPGFNSIWVCLKMLCTPLYPMVLLIIIPIKWLAIIGNINPTFSDKPIL